MNFNEEDMEKVRSVVNEIKDKTLKFGGGILFRGEEKVFPDPCSSSLFRRLDWEIVCPAGPEDTMGKVITNRLQIVAFLFHFSRGFGEGQNPASCFCIPTRKGKDMSS